MIWKESRERYIRERFIYHFRMMLEKVRKEVENLLWKDASWHGMDHIQRVEKLSLQFAETENGDLEIISLIALLHDVDDYKLVGEEQSKEMTNTKRILEMIDLSSERKEVVLREVSSIGYKKALKGVFPQTLEGKIVSDADKCDAMGAVWLLRAYQYAIIHHQVFFEKNLFLQSVKDQQGGETTAVNHLFEKVLKLKEFLFTEAGKKEAEIRHQWMIHFLQEFFREEFFSYNFLQA